MSAEDVGWLLDVIAERGLRLERRSDGSPCLKGPKEEVTPALADAVKAFRAELLEHACEPAVAVEQAAPEPEKPRRPDSGYVARLVAAGVELVVREADAPNIVEAAHLAAIMFHESGNADAFFAGRDSLQVEPAVKQGDYPALSVSEWLDVFARNRKRPGGRWIGERNVPEVSTRF